MPQHSALAYGRAALRLLAHNAGRHPFVRFCCYWLLADVHRIVAFGRHLALLAEQGPVSERSAWQLVHDHAHLER